MKISDLPSAPQWLLDAKTENAGVNYDHLGRVVWLGGEWHYGTWRDGEWRGGTWHGGTWREGIWRGGIWLGGTWHGGTWLAGEWHGGTRSGGISAMSSPYTPYLHSDGRIKVGCKTMTTAEWRAWLSSDEEFDTPRDSSQFLLIKAHILAMCLYAETLAEESALESDT